MIEKGVNPEALAVSPCYCLNLNSTYRKGKDADIGQQVVKELRHEAQEVERNAGA